MFLFRKGPRAARAALKELTALTLTARDDIMQAARDVDALTPAELWRELASWIDDAREVDAWRRVLRWHGF